MSDFIGSAPVHSAAPDPAPRRWDVLDTIRGLTLVSMILYHACWDLVWIWGVPWQWYLSRGAYLWQQSICRTFLLLSGFCFHLGHYPYRRGALIFGSGALITAVTVLWMPENRVFFGVLSLLGSAILITAALETALRRIPPVPGLLLCVTLFHLTRAVPAGVLSLGGAGPSFSGGIVLLRLPAALYRSDWTAALGFPPPGFFSTDYFPLLPWLFLFWAGYFLFPLLAPRLPSLRNGRLIRFRLPVLTVAGRHSLFLYLIHQIVLYALLSLWFFLWRAITP